MGEYPHGQGSNIRPAGCSPFTAERLSFVWSFIQPPRCGGGRTLASRQILSLSASKHA